MCMEKVDTPHSNIEKVLPTEIERKFIISPSSLEEIKGSLPLIEKRKITQAYLEITDECEVRIRKTEKNSQVSYECTVKTKLDDDKNGLVRGEVTEVITAEEFDEAMQKHIGNVINKTRLAFALDGNTLEVDVYQGDLKGLLSAEIEFNSTEASEKFETPAWLDLDHEVTYRKDFKNQQLALHGIPQDYLSLD